MRVSLNVSIRWVINVYDKNTYWGKGIPEHNLFSQNTSLAAIYEPPKSKVIFRPIFRLRVAILKMFFAL
jgi:hypothetical protein